MIKKLCHTGAPTGMYVGSSAEFFEDIRTVQEYMVHSKQDPQDEADKDTRYDETKRKFVPVFNLSKPTGYVTHQQFNIQQLYALPTLYLCFVFI